MGSTFLILELINHVMKKTLLPLLCISWLATISALVCYQCELVEIGKYSQKKTVTPDKCSSYDEKGKNVTCSNPLEFCNFKWVHENRHPNGKKLTWRGCKIPHDRKSYRHTEDGKQMCEDLLPNVSPYRVIGGDCYCKTDLCNSKAVSLANLVSVAGLSVCVAVAMLM